MALFRLLTFYILAGEINFLLAKYNEVNLISDVVNSYDVPTAIIAFGCWKTNEKNYLVKQLAFSARPKTVNFVREDQSMFSLKRSHHSVIVVDGKCPKSRSFLKYANDTQMFRYSQRWLLIKGYGNETRNVEDEYHDLNILLDSEVIVAVQIDDHSFELQMIYKTQQLGWITEYFGSWDDRVGLRKTANMAISPSLRRRNLGLESITITFPLTSVDPKIDFDDQMSYLNNPQKWGYRHSTILYEFINATRKIIFTDNWGYFVNGTWNGMLGDIVRGKAELTGSSMFITIERLDELYFLSNPIKTGVRFVFREPPLSYQNNLFLLPFETKVWLCSVGFVMLLLIVLYINTYWEKKITNQSEDVIHEGVKQRLSDMAMIVISAIAQQGSSVEMKGTVGRLVIFILFMVFLFLYTSYSANIVALLQSRSKQIRNLKDLLDSRLELGVENTSYNRYLFKAATEPVRKAIYDTKIAPQNNFMSLEEGVKKLQNSPFGFNMDLGSGYKVVEKMFHEHEKCGLQEIAFMLPQRPWTACKKDSPYAQLYKLCNYRIREFGLSSRINRMLFASKPSCTYDGGSFSSVSLVDMYPLLLMLLYGTLLAFGILLVEIIAHRWETQHSKMRTRPVYVSTEIF